VAAVVVIVALGAVGVVFYAMSGGDEDVAGSGAGSGADDVRAGATQVTALGRIEPRSEVIDVSGVAGSRLLALETEEGDYVERGAVLARLYGFDERSAARDAARARLSDASDLHDAELAVGQAAIEEAELRRRQITRLRPLEIRAQKAEVRRIEAERDNAERRLRRLQSLDEAGQSTKQALDDRQAEVSILTETLGRADIELQRLRAAVEIDRARAESAIRSARATMDRARAAAGVATRTAELATAQAEMESMVVRAPVKGRVLKILTRPGERLAESPILKLGDTEEMYAVAEVYETDARFVEEGQRALIDSSALPAPIAGTVERISHLVFKNDVLDIDPAAPVDARVVEVRIRLDDSEVAEQFSNLQVRVTIERRSE
jgi:HlyD family secretion protein